MLASDLIMLTEKWPHFLMIFEKVLKNLEKCYRIYAVYAFVSAPAGLRYGFGSADFGR